MNIFGAILLMLGGAGATLYILGREQCKLLCVEGLARLLSITVENIKSYAKPAPEILKNCGRELLSACSYSEELDIPESFSEMLEGCDISDADARELFASFCSSFGGSQRVDEAAKCEYYASRMRERAEKLRSGASGRKKAVISLGGSLTLIILILLL